MKETYSTHRTKVRNKNEKKSVTKEGKKNVKHIAKLKSVNEEGPKVTVKVEADSEEELDEQIGGATLDSDINIVIGTNQSTLDDHAE